MSMPDFDMVLFGGTGDLARRKLLPSLFDAHHAGLLHPAARILATGSQPLSTGDYVASLDEDHFRRSLVFLRRAFGGFSAREKRQIAENLAEHWGVSADAASDAIEKELTETEEKTLKDLNEFNFDDL